MHLKLTLEEIFTTGQVIPMMFGDSYHEFTVAEATTERVRGTLDGVPSTRKAKTIIFLHDLTLDRIKQIWCEVYVRTTHQNPHEEFARRLKVPRHKAKEICYKMMWDTPFLASAMMALAELETKEINK